MIIFVFRVVTDRWKGMSPAQLEEIRRIQEQQRQEKRVSVESTALYVCIHRYLEEKMSFL